MCVVEARSFSHQNSMKRFATRYAGLEEEGEDTALVAGMEAGMEAATEERVGEEVVTTDQATAAAAAAAGDPTGAAVATLAAVVTPGKTARDLLHPS